MNTVHHPVVAPSDQGFHLSLVPAAVTTAMRHAAARKGSYWKVPRAKVRVLPGFNVRERSAKYLRHIESIKNSMMVSGWLEAEPIDGFCATVEENGKRVEVIYVIGGHTRLEAHDLAVAAGRRIPYVPVVVSQEPASMVDLTVRIWSGNNAMPLSPYEMSKLVKRLADLSLSEPEIAKRLDVTSQTVRDMLVLASAPSEVHERVAAGVMSPTLAVEMIREHGARVVFEVEAAIRRAAAEGKDRFTRKHVTGAKVAAAVKKSAASAFELIQQISRDPACAELAPNLRNRIADLLQRVSDATGSPKTEAVRPVDSLTAFEEAIANIKLAAANDELDVTFDASVCAA